MPQAPILNIFDRFPGQTVVPNGSLFGRFPDIFAYLLKKCDLSKTCTGVSGLHVQPSPGAPFSPNLSSKSSVVKKRPPRLMRGMRQVLRWGGGLPKRRGKKGAGTGIVQRLRHTKRAKARWRIYIYIYICIEYIYIERERDYRLYMCIYIYIY